MTKLGTLPRPDCFPEVWEEPKPEPRLYWEAQGKCDPSKPIGRLPADSPAGSWLSVNLSKDEAEAYACWMSDERWQWDRRDACPVTLHDALARARQRGFDGICLVEFIDGAWTVTRTWRADEPTPKDDV